jgi:hypothetical protein
MGIAEAGQRVRVFGAVGEAGGEIGPGGGRRGGGRPDDNLDPRVRHAAAHRPGFLGLQKTLLLDPTLNMPAPTTAPATTARRAARLPHDLR